LTKEFKPMGSTTNCTTVHYGTTWDDATLLEEIKQTNLELARKDGIKRHFRYDWQEVAKYNPDYEAYVMAERGRLGEDHPLFRTQYALLPIKGGGGFFSREQLEQLKGEHSRRSHPEAGKVYVAGIDLGGESEVLEDAPLRVLSPRKDSTVVTIAELDFSKPDALSKQPVIRVVEHYRWTGRRHAELYFNLVDLLKNVWKCKKVVVDATGLGQPVYSFLRESLGSRVEPFTFTAQSKSELGFNLLALINAGKLKVYKSDGSADCQEFWTEMEKAKSQYRQNRTMNFFVDPSQGHDDFLMSLALAAEAGRDYTPREARGSSGAGLKQTLI
jgi:hypothetical protein